MLALARGIRAAIAAWDAVSDSLCDDDGFPLDDDEYGAGQSRRDAAAWHHFARFLDHGDRILGGLARHPSAQGAMGELNIQALQHTLADGRVLRAAYEDAEERDAEAWHDMVTFAEIVERMLPPRAPETDQLPC